MLDLCAEAFLHPFNVGTEESDKEGIKNLTFLQKGKSRFLCLLSLALMTKVFLHTLFGCDMVNIVDKLSFILSYITDN